MTGIISDNVGRPSGLIKASSGGGGGVWTLIKTLTASSDSTLSFVDGSSDVVFDSTYPIYVFKFINIHNDTDNGGIDFQCSINAGSSYGVAVTSTSFRAEHDEADSDTTFAYRGDDYWDQAQGTNDQRIIDGTGNASDESGSGELWFFNPASTVFVKHWFSNTSVYHGADYAINYRMAGYFNTTSAIDAIQFGTVSGTFDGKIKLYGLKDSA
jgi:hypothetical protein